MPGTGVSTAAILTRRRAASGRGRHAPHFEQFLVEQLERITRIADQRIARVRQSRRARAMRAINQAGTELEVTVRGAAGSDAQPGVDPLLREVL